MNEALRLLGLIYKSGRMLLGEEVLKNLHKIKLLLIADDISDSSRARYEKKCKSYGIEHIDSFSAEELSQSLGKGNVKVIGIADEGFAKSLMKKCNK